jgi:hypothetical protein
MKLDDIVYLENIDCSPKQVKAVRQMLNEVQSLLALMTTNEACDFLKGELICIQEDYDFDWSIENASTETESLIIKVRHSPINEWTMFRIDFVISDS